MVFVSIASIIMAKLMFLVFIGVLAVISVPIYGWFYFGVDEFSPMPATKEVFIWAGLAVVPQLTYVSKAVHI